MELKIRETIDTEEEIIHGIRDERNQRLGKQ